MQNLCKIYAKSMRNVHPEKNNWQKTNQKKYHYLQYYKKISPLFAVL